MGKGGAVLPDGMWGPSGGEQHFQPLQQRGGERLDVSRDFLQGAEPLGLLPGVESEHGLPHTGEGSLVGGPAQRPRSGFRLLGPGDGP